MMYMFMIWKGDIFEDKPLKDKKCSNLFKGSQEYEESADFFDPWTTIDIGCISKKKFITIFQSFFFSLIMYIFFSGV
jgi:hypothetical protein